MAKKNWECKIESKEAEKTVACERIFFDHITFDDKIRWPFFIWFHHFFFSLSPKRWKKNSSNSDDVWEYFFFPYIKILWKDWKQTHFVVFLLLLLLSIAESMGYMYIFMHKIHTIIFFVDVDSNKNKTTDKQCYREPKSMRKKEEVTAFKRPSLRCVQKQLRIFMIRT